MRYEPESLKLLARGGQADIYALDNGRILRVLRDTGSDAATMLQNECTLMQALRSRGLDVPEVFEFTHAGEQPAAVMQRIQGPSMLDGIAANPLCMGREARTLARLHSAFLRCMPPDGLMEARQRADILIDRSTLLGDEDRAFIRGLLSGLPEGNALLHGDFHPGNILVEAGKHYVIDWFGAARGDALADIAHTYLLCAFKPRIPSEGILAYTFMRAAARRFGGMYLKAMRVQFGLDMERLGKWLAVRAAERTAYGQPSEVGARAAFVKACRAMQAQGMPSSRWYKAL